MKIERFEHIDLKNEKIVRIVNCGFEVFSKNDFQKASTNLIVAEAEISRGLLYHYFKNKQELFEFLLYFSGKQILFNIVEAVDWSNSNYLLRVRQALIAKIETLAKFPFLYEFCNKYRKEYSVEITEKIMPGIQNRFFTENLDFSKIREGIDIELMKNTINFTLGGVIIKIFEKKSKLREEEIIQIATAEVDRYLEFFKIAFYY